MKLATQILYLLLLSGFASAQYQYVPMPLDIGQWRYRQAWNFQNNPTTDDYLLMGSNADTLINGFTYKRIMQRTCRVQDDSLPIQSVVATWPDYTNCFLREDNKRVYWWRWNGQDTRDTLIYDFNRIVGDTLPTVFNMYPGAYNFTYIIRVIDTVTLGGLQRKRLKATHIMLNPGDTIEAIEGIGSNRGLIMNNATGAYGLYNFVNEFHCYTEQGFEYNPNNIPCSYIWNSSTPVSISADDQSRLSLYPNPFAAYVTLETPADATLRIYNNTGRAISSMAVSKGTKNINTEALPPGIYLITVTDQSGRLLYNKKLLKQ